MKRKMFALLLALVMVLGLAAAASAAEDRITSGDWEYRLSDGKAVLCRYLGSDTEVIVPASIDGYAVSEVGPDVFCAFTAVKDTMTSVVLSEGIELINTNAFKGCTALEWVYIPGTVRYIGTYAFYDCTSLYDVYLEEGLQTISAFAFANTDLTAVLVPASVTEIGDKALGYAGEWGNAEQLDDFAIFGYTDTSAEEYASKRHFTFYRMEDMTDSSGRCGDDAAWRFEASTGTLYIEGEGDTDPYYNGIQPWIMFSEEITRVVIGEGIDHLGDSSFAFCYPNLREVVLSESTHSLGNGAFRDCTGLSKVSFPASLSFIGGSTFRNTGLKEVVFPEVTDHDIYIGGYAFADCTALERVKLPRTIEQTGNGVFANCSKLSEVDLSGWTYSGSLGNEMFRNCDSLTNIDFHTITSINPGMYQDCDGLRNVVIPACVTYLHTDAFADCSNLANVVFLGDVPSYNADVFRNDTLTGWYPADNATWTESHLHGHGGTITWMPYDVLSFTDVLPFHFYYDPVAWAVENGITNGLSATEFGPEASCNRAQIVTFLYRASALPTPEPPASYTFTLTTNDPDEETGFAFCEGETFTEGESVIFYAEPMYGYLVEFTAEPADESLELYYLGAYTYELVMPAHDVTLTANFVPAEGDAHYITTNCENGESIALCDFDEDFNDFAKPGEYVLFYVIADEGYTLTPENISATVNGEAWENIWYLGEIVEEDPDLGTIDGVFLVEMLMPDADVTVTFTCTAEASAEAEAVRTPVTIR